jgi:hypothetical protein
MLNYDKRMDTKDFHSPGAPKALAGMDEQVAHHWIEP